MAYTPIHLNEDELINRLPKLIGQVSLNYDYYGGSDLYSDGDIEDRLLDIVKNRSKYEYQQIIEESMSWPILYHLSAIRGNIVDFLPITKEDKVLEIGSGCGAITETLAKKAKSVTCVDLSARRSQINAYRNQDCDNINIYVGNFSDIEPHLDTDYDYVCLIGVFEYGSSYINTDTPYEDFLKIILKHKKDNGRCVIAIENKYGLKYWAGCKEDHNGEFFSSIEGYPNGGSARTFTINGFRKIFKACNVSDYNFYYPYPDYKLPHTIFSDDRLPLKGELTDNLRNLDRDRMLLFDESRAFDEIIDDGEYPLFSNSYMVITGPKIDTIYAKYSNDRKPEFAIKTEILGINNRCVQKVPLNSEAALHLKKLSNIYEKLVKRYEGSSLKINKCSFDEKTGIATFDFEEGETLENLLDEAVKHGNMERFNELIDKYINLISYNPNNVEITDFDMIFANILVNGDNWTVIDYEWSYEKIIDPKKVAFRALYCYVLEDDRRNSIDMDSILNKLGITQRETSYYIEEEEAFQKEVTGNHKAIGEIRATIGTYAISSEKLFNEELKKIIDKRIQVYYDYGQGYSEENSKYIPDVYEDNSHISVDINFDGNVKGLRIDPADQRCLVKVTELVLNGENILNNKKIMESNGKALNSATFAFNTMDPNINIKLNEVLIRGENELHVVMEITPMTEKLVVDVINSVKKIF
ncbi:MAG: class I SAM-dependent methyltransferase [Lachnospiraceae bacterium]|nr:class I SAM-dependent methyltransferase [Lachnospiraceae bacterium]